jgi:hypothetical protein
MKTSLALFLGRLEFFVFFAEPFNAAGRVNQLLLACKKRVALGTNFHSDVFSGRTGFQNRTAVTRDRGFFVSRVNVFFHF